MAFTSEQKAEIIRVFVSKTLRNAPCFMCGQESWNLNDGIVFLPLQTLEQLNLGVRGVVLPNIVVNCTACGLTLLFNIYNLGLAERLGLPPQIQPVQGGN